MEYVMCLFIGILVHFFLYVCVFVLMNDELGGIVKKFNS